jgi:hypothetical protein
MIIKPRQAIPAYSGKSLNSIESDIYPGSSVVDPSVGPAFNAEITLLAGAARTMGERKNSASSK